jgi:hypothetical protein
MPFYGDADTLSRATVKGVEVATSFKPSPMFRFTIRDLLWLMVVVVGWYVTPAGAAKLGRYFGDDP